MSPAKNDDDLYFWMNAHVSVGTNDGIVHRLSKPPVCRPAVPFLDFSAGQVDSNGYPDIVVTSYTL